MLTLKNFEKEIDKTILKRGFDYFEDGNVVELEELEPGRWDAVVEGTEDYTVKVTIEDNEIIASQCTCPYDMGPVCKHEVAVYYAVKRQEGGNVLEFSANREDKKQPKKEIKKAPTIADKIDNALNKIQADALKVFVKEYAVEDKYFRSALFVLLPADESGDSIKMYRDIVKAGLKSGKDKHGFIDYSHAPGATRPAYDLLEKADKFLQNKNYRHVADISIVVIEEIVKAIQFMDDSDGMVTDLTHWAFDLLNTSADETAGTDFGRELFQLCIKQSGNKIYEGWDFAWSFIETASLLISDKNDIDKVFNMIDGLTDSKKDKDFSRYDYERAAVIKYPIIRKWTGEKEAEDFLRKNINYPDIRELAIEENIKNGNIDYAEKLALDGLNIDKAPGIVSTWMNYLLIIALEKGNRDDIIDRSKALFLDSGDFDYYGTLKEQYSEKEWKDNFASFVNYIKKNSGYLHQIFPEIYIREKRWEDLLEYAEMKPDKYTLKHCHTHLAEHYPAELAGFYEKAVFEELTHTGRDFYKEACGMLRKMKKLGAKDRVEEIRIELKEKFKNRPALLDELEKV